MKNTLIGGLVAVGIFVALAWIAQPTKTGTDTLASVPQTSAVGVLTARETTYDFGTISMAAGKVTHVYTVTNTGTEPVNIGKMYTSCMCTTASVTLQGRTFGPYGMPGHGSVFSVNQVLAPGQEAPVEVIFDPAAHGPAGVGKIQRVVTLENNGGQPIKLYFSAMVTP
ncbi:MAG: DUF1573 domain-containing protein [Patescibacteria group bacterium]